MCPHIAVQHIQALRGKMQVEHGLCKVVVLAVLMLIAPHKAVF